MQCTFHTNNDNNLISVDSDVCKIHYSTYIQQLTDKSLIQIHNESNTAC